MNNLLESINQIFTVQLHSNNVLLPYMLAFLGGIISSISPCTLGILPIIIGYVGGFSEKTDKKTIIQVIFFVVGLSLVLTVLGVSSAIAGKAFGSHAGPVWILIMASFILTMGLSMLEILEIPAPSIVKQMPQNTNNSIILYPIILGGAFAFATTPCSTPLLAGIVAYSSIKANILTGAIMLFLFSLGQGVILIIAGLFTSLFKKILELKHYSSYLLKVSGIILILASLNLYLSVFGIL